MKNLIKLIILTIAIIPKIAYCQLNISETPNPTTITYKGTTTYYGSVNVTGTVSNVHVIKTLPPGLRFVSSPQNATVTGGVIDCGGETIDINLGNLNGGTGQFIFYEIVVRATCPAYPNIINYQSTPSIVSGTGLSSASFTSPTTVVQAVINPLSWLKLNKTIQTPLPFYNNYAHVFYNQSIVFKISVSTDPALCPPTCCATAMPTITNIELKDNMPPTAVLDGANPVLDGSNTPLPASSYSFTAGVLTINSPVNYTLCSAPLDFYVRIKIPCQTSPNSIPIPNTVLSNTVNLSFNPVSTYTNYRTSSTSFIIKKNEVKAKLSKEVKTVTGTNCPALYYYNLRIIDTGTVKLDGYTISDTFPANITVNKIVTPVSSTCSYTIKYKFVNTNNTSPDANYTTYTGSPVAPATTLLIPGAINPPAGKKIFAIQIIGGGTGCTILPPGIGFPDLLSEEAAQVYYSIDPATPSGATIINTASGSAHGFDNTTTNCSFPIDETVSLSASVTQNINLAAFQLVKTICNPKACYNIGDTIIFDYALKNNGTGGSIPSGASLADYFWTCGLQFLSLREAYVSHSLSPSNCPAGGPAFTNINSISSSLIYPAGWLQGNCLPSNDSVIHIKINTIVGPTSSGQKNCQYPAVNITQPIPGGSTTYSIANGNPVSFKVCDKDSLTYIKEISTDGGNTWGTSGTVTGGSTIQYRLKLKNSGTHTYPISAVNPLIFSDVFPNNSVNEGTISTRCGSRGSDINLTLSPYSATNYEAKLNNTTNLPANFNFFNTYSADLAPNYGTGYFLCNTTTATSQLNTNSGGNDKTFVYSTSTPALINIGDEFTITIKNIVIPNIPYGTTKNACNSFAVKAGVTAIGESNTVCLTINSSTPSCTTCTIQSTITKPNNGGDITLTPAAITIECDKTYNFNAPILSCSIPNSGMQVIETKIYQGPNNIPYWATNFSGSGNLYIPAFGPAGGGNSTIYIKYVWGTATTRCDSITYPIIISCPGCVMYPCTMPNVAIYKNGANPVQLNTTNFTAAMECNNTYAFSPTLSCGFLPGSGMGLTYGKIYDANNVTPTWASSYNPINNSVTIPNNVSGTYYLKYKWGNSNSNCDSLVCTLIISCPIPPANCIACTASVSSTGMVSFTNNNDGTGKLIQGFHFTNLPVVITEVRATVTDIKIWATDATGNKVEECLSCFSNPFAWGSIVNGVGIAGANPVINMNGNIVNAPVIVQKNQNPRNITWSSGNVLQLLSNIKLDFLLPQPSTLSCCTRKATICVKFVFRDDNCNECIISKCFDAELK